MKARRIEIICVGKGAEGPLFEGRIWEGAVEKRTFQPGDALKTLEEIAAVVTVDRLRDMSRGTPSVQYWMSVDEATRRELGDHLKQYRDFLDSANGETVTPMSHYKD